MFKRLRVKTPSEVEVTELPRISLSQLIGDASLPITIKALNGLPENFKLRLYRTLIPVQVLTDYDINPRTWMNLDKQPQVNLRADEGSNKVFLFAWFGEDQNNRFFYLELADNSFNGIDLNFIVINNPLSEKYGTDFDEGGRETHFGTVYRNLAEEQRAMVAGLSPGQIRSGLRSSQIIFTHIETFLTLMAHHAIFLEPLTYVSAWIFERRGFAYVKGHKLMDTIHKEFQPGGELNKALDGSTPFRQPDQWNTVRGRAWAIHDGILDVIDKRWDDLRMIKQVGRHAGVSTFPDATY
jgi:hypothetical protein